MSDRNISRDVLYYRVEIPCKFYVNLLSSLFFFSDKNCNASLNTGCLQFLLFKGSSLTKTDLDGSKH